MISSFSIISSDIRQSGDILRSNYLICPLSGEMVTRSSRALILVESMLEPLPPTFSRSGTGSSSSECTLLYGVECWKLWQELLHVISVKIQI